MSKILDVYLHQSLVGQLLQDRSGRVSFSYEEDWLQSTEACPLSHSLPLRSEPFNSRECQAFFAGVLPEESNRELIAKLLGISARNDFAMLQQIGGECAGAVSLYSPGSPPSPQEKQSYQALTESELAEVLRELPRRPLMAGRKDIRLSLAGAQNKLAVHFDGTRISLPLHGSASSHILKPEHEHFAGLTENEQFCMTLARKAGLPVADVSPAPPKESPTF